MSINVTRGKSDEVIDRMIDALRAYETDHPNARIDLYRQNSVSVRVRIIDPDLAGQSKADRSKYVWKYLNVLTDEVQSDLSALILITPEETKTSFSNIEFEDPIPWSDQVAALAADALVDAQLISRTDFERAAAIISEEINARLCLGDFPPANETDLPPHA